MKNMAESLHLAEEMIAVYHSIDIRNYSDSEIINLQNLLSFVLNNREKKEKTNS